MANGGRALDWEAAFHKDKCFHVSPFFDLVGQYRFTFSQPGNAFRVAINETRQGEPIFDSTLGGSAAALTDGRLVAEVLRMPFMTLKVVAGIHWEALKLWLRGASFHTKPLPPKTEWS